MDELTVLALAARDGDPVSLAAFARASYRDVWRLSAYLGGPDLADDLTQEAYVRALRALPGFRGESSARTWLLSIAKRTVADDVRTAVRRRRPSSARPADVDTIDPSELVDLQNLIGSLDPDRRSAFVLTQVVGLSYAETAEICDCSIGTIRSRVARARGRLADAVQRSMTA